MLELRGLHARYGAIRALESISLAVPVGAIVSLLGANGAGKTTLLAAIMGLISDIDGAIVFDGRDITGYPTDDVVRAGIALAPEGRQVFADLCVEDNLRMGAYLRRDRDIDADFTEIYGLFPRLRERRRQSAGTLSGGEQQMVALGRAMMSRPKLLLLDEPSLGLAPRLVTEMMRLIREINRRGVTILLVEQNARQALRISTTGHVIEKGRLRMSGPAKELIDDPHVVSTYLGGH